MKYCRYSQFDGTHNTNGEYFVLQAYSLWGFLNRVFLGMLMKDHPTWFNSEIRYAIKCRRSLRHKCFKHPTPSNHSKIHSLETRLKELMISAKSHFEKQLATQPPSKVFKYIRGFSSASSIPSSVSLDSSTASDVQDKASLFNIFFHSVYIYPTCLPNSSSGGDASTW